MIHNYSQHRGIRVLLLTHNNNTNAVSDSYTNCIKRTVHLNIEKIVNFFYFALTWIIAFCEHTVKKLSAVVLILFFLQILMPIIIYLCLLFPNFVLMPMQISASQMNFQC